MPSLSPASGTQSDDRPDIEGFVGRALRLMSMAVLPVLPQVTTGVRVPSSDPYDLLRWMIDHENRANLPTSDRRVLAAAYRALDLRNRWAHPSSSGPLGRQEALRGVDAMIVVTGAFGADVSRVRNCRAALDAATGNAELEKVPAVVNDDADRDDAPGVAADEISARMTNRPHTAAAYSVAAVVRERVFASGSSVFGLPGPIWSVENLKALERLLPDETAPGLNEFRRLFADLLVDTSTELVQLGAEVLYVQLWINAKSLKGATKREAINAILRLRLDTTPMPRTVATALDMGLVRTGAWFHQQRWRHLRVIVRTRLRLHGMEALDAASLLADPWSFQQWILEDNDGLAQRHALLHLLFPDVFEAIVSVDDKARILAKLGHHLGSRTGNVDRDLYELRRVLAVEYGPRFDYYRRPVVELWREPGIAVDD
jgi:hypothetical protein